MFSFIRKKRKILIPRSWNETAAGRDEGRKCPFLQPFVARDGIGTNKKVEQECMESRCEIWDEENERCSIYSTAKILNKITKRE